MFDVESVVGPGWEVVRTIGSGGYGTVYEIQRDNFGAVEKAALKVISIPKSSDYIEELYSEGISEAGVTTRLQRHRDDIVKEYTLMKAIKGHTNVVYCDDLIYRPHKDNAGWDIYIKMELLTPMMKMEETEMSQEQVIKFGIDICRALVECQRLNIIHRDLKPQNIFVSESGNFKLGDFGVSKIAGSVAKQTAVGTNVYMAPEVYYMKPYGCSVDIYALGLIMYWLLNKRRRPFLPLPPEEFTEIMDYDAMERRFSGEEIPAPVNGTPALHKIVLKACTADPKVRYATAAEMLKDLEKLQNREMGETVSLLDKLRAWINNVNIKQLLASPKAIACFAAVAVLLGLCILGPGSRSPFEGQTVYGWQEHKGHLYYFGNDGVMRTGWQEIDGKQCYFTAKGVAMTGIQKIDGVQHHFDDEGFAVSGWVESDGLYYYYDAQGVNQTGWISTKSGRYYTGSDGIMRTGWQKIDEKKYYFSAAGLMQTGWQTISGKTYYFDKDGAMKTKWQNIDGNRYYFDDEGAMQIRWQDIGGKRYFFSQEGIMRIGWQNIDGNRYYFAKDGVMLTKWQEIDGNRYFFSPEGILRIRWQKIDNKQYFFSNEGVMRTFWQEIDGNRYYFGSDGVMRTRWQDIDGKRYFFSAEGVLRTYWQDIDGTRYYFGADGAMVTGERTIDGKVYNFSSDGALIG